MSPTAFHYSPFNNNLSILSKGLIPAPTRRIQPHPGESSPYVIWLWEQPLKGEFLLLHSVFLLSKHCAQQEYITEFEVLYQPNEVIGVDYGAVYTITPDMSLDKWRTPSGIPAVVLTHFVPPDRISIRRVLTVRMKTMSSIGVKKEKKC